MHRLLQPKVALDHTNEALLKETEYPAADKTYNNPFYSKAREPEQIKHGAAKKELSRFRGSRKAEVKMHEAPRMLPPRNELRSHLDEEVKKELEADLE